MNCDLMKSQRMKINQVSIERSRITKRTPRFSNLNIQSKTLDSENLGKIYVKITNRTLRTIEKYNGLDNFLLSIKRKSLTEYANKLRRSLIKKTKHVFTKEIKSDK